MLFCKHCAGSEENTVATTRRNIRNLGALDCAVDLQTIKIQKLGSHVKVAFFAERKKTTTKDLEQIWSVLFLEQAENYAVDECFVKKKT